MKRAFNVWCVFSHNDKTGWYKFKQVYFCDMKGEIHYLCDSERFSSWQYDSIAGMLPSVLIELKRNDYYVGYNKFRDSRVYYIYWRNIEDEEAKWYKYAFKESVIPAIVDK